MDDTTPMVSREISRFGEEASQGSAGQRFLDYTQGNEAASGLLKDEGGFDKSLSYQNPQLSAIKSKYGGDFNLAMRRNNLNSFKAAEEDHLRKVQIANELAGKEMALNQQKEQLRKQRKAAGRAARGQLIGNVLGVVGAVVGGVLTYGAGAGAGAAAGYAAGQGIGNAVGGG